MIDHVSLSQLPPVPEDATFRLVKVEKVGVPHPYCITAKHVEVAADHHSGILDVGAIEDAERRGARCDICRAGVRRRKQGRVLAFAEHENPLTLFIAVTQNDDLNAIPGLGAYLNQVKAAALGIEGFAFPRL